jgi:hypothetical protein
MAKRRKSTRKVSTRRCAPFRLKRKASRRKSSSGKVKALQIDAMLYGAVAQASSGYVDKIISSFPVLARVPLGLADEVVRGTASYFAAKKGSGKIKAIGMKGLIVENARVGAAGASMLMNGMGGQTQTTGSTYTYG